MILATAGINVARWIGIEQLCASVVPSSRNRLADASSPSLTIGENELRILLRLAQGQLEFDLFNTKQGEYAYAADYDTVDDDRRHVFTWRRKNRINQGRWRLDYPY